MKTNVHVRISGNSLTTVHVSYSDRDECDLFIKLSRTPSTPRYTATSNHRPGRNCCSQSSPSYQTQRPITVQTLKLECNISEQKSSRRLINTGSVHNGGPPEIYGDMHEDLNWKQTFSLPNYLQIHTASVLPSCEITVNDWYF